MLEEEPALPPDQVGNEAWPPRIPPPSARVVLVALKTYGMILADNGSDWYVSGTADARWSDDEINTLKQVRGSDFEVVAMGTVMTD